VSLFRYVLAAIIIVLIALFKWSDKVRNLLGIRKDLVDVQKAKLDMEKTKLDLQAAASPIIHPTNVDVSRYDPKIRRLMEKVVDVVDHSSVWIIFAILFGGLLPDLLRWIKEVFGPSLPK
jgi:uncharacterized membrane protein YraQ (UPF0718 family)